MNNQVKSLRLSDAIALGQHLITWTNERTLSNGRGCACGMALAAHGEQMANATDFYNRYPWGKELSLHRKITYYFGHVMHGELTLDQLIDFVRSIEPAEEEAPVHGEAVQGEPAIAPALEAMEIGAKSR